MKKVFFAKEDAPNASSVMADNELESILGGRKTAAAQQDSCYYRAYIPKNQ